MPLDVVGPNTGDTAPDFTLTEASGESVALEQLRGQNVLLIFYRGAW
jgi:peroxiredoxin Q/BCP